MDNLMTFNIGRVLEENLVFGECVKYWSGQFDTVLYKIGTGGDLVGVYL